MFIFQSLVENVKCLHFSFVSIFPLGELRTFALIKLLILLNLNLNRLLCCGELMLKRKVVLVVVFKGCF